MRDRFRMQEVWQNLGFDVKECMAAVETSPYYQAYQSLLFSRIVPCVKDIGLWGDKVQKAYADMGVLDMAGVDLDALMKQDEDIAEQVDAEKAELAASAVEVEKTIAVGADRLTGDACARAGRPHAARPLGGVRFVPPCPTCLTICPTSSAQTAVVMPSRSVTVRACRALPRAVRRVGHRASATAPAGGGQKVLIRAVPTDAAPPGGGARRRPGRLDRSGSQWRDRSVRPGVASADAPVRREGSSREPSSVGRRSARSSGAPPPRPARAAARRCSRCRWSAARWPPGRRWPTPRRGRARSPRSWRPPWRPSSRAEAADVVEVAVEDVADGGGRERRVRAGAAATPVRGQPTRPRRVAARRGPRGEPGARPDDVERPDLVRRPSAAPTTAGPAARAPTR